MKWKIHHQVILYLGIALMQSLQVQLPLIADGKLNLMTPTDVSLLIVNLLLPCAITLKALLNQDLSGNLSAG